MARSPRRTLDPVLVVGLGRFGAAVAETLVAMGHEVLAVDDDPERVQELSGTLTSVVEADSTSQAAMQQLGAGEFTRAVVAMGADLEASILSVGVLVDLGVPHISAKASTAAHGRILLRVGAHDVVHVEHDMGVRMAHRVTGRMLEYLQLDESFAIVETVAPASLLGRSLAASQVRGRFGVVAVCVKPPGGRFTWATADTVLGEGDVLVVAGEHDAVERFANTV